MEVEIEKMELVPTADSKIELQSMQSVDLETEPQPLQPADRKQCKRFRFTISQKIELLDLVKQGVPRPQICRAYNLSTSSLANFLQEEPKIRAMYERSGDPNRLSLRKTPFHQLESELLKWIISIQEQNIPLNGPIVQEKALEMAERIGADGFSASNGWLTRFKARENIDFKTPTKISNKPKIAKPLVPAPRPALPQPMRIRPPSSPSVKDFLPSSTAATCADSDFGWDDAPSAFSPDPPMPPDLEYPFSSSSSLPVPHLTASMSGGVLSLEQSLVDLELEHIRRMSALLKHYKLLLIVEGDEDGLQVGGDADLQRKIFGPEAASGADAGIKSETPFGMYDDDFADADQWDSVRFPSVSKSQPTVHPLPAPLAGQKRKSSAKEPTTTTQKRKKHKPKKPAKGSAPQSASLNDLGGASRESLSTVIPFATTTSDASKQNGEERAKEKRPKEEGYEGTGNNHRPNERVVEDDKEEEEEQDHERATLVERPDVPSLGHSFVNGNSENSNEIVNFNCGANLLDDEEDDPP